MTVNTTNITSGPYTGNGVTTIFSYTFRIENKNQLKVFETDSIGIETQLTVDTDYTVDGIGTDAGGTITRVAGALPIGYTWYIRSNYLQTQQTAFVSQGAFFPRVHESAMDKLTFLIQQINDQVSRAFKFSDSYSGTASAELPVPTPLNYVRWNNAGTALENVPGTSGGAFNVSDESLTVTDGVVLYTFSNATVNGAALYIGEPYGQSGKRMILGYDYQFRVDVGPKTIELLNGFPAGWIITAVYINEPPSSEVRPEYFDTLQDVGPSTAISVTGYVQTLGYNSVGDGGANLYKVVAAATGVDDGGSFIDLTGIPGQLQGIFPGGVNVKQFGAVGDGVTDDTAAIQAAINYGEPFHIPVSSDYMVSSLTVPGGTRITGDGRAKTVIRQIPDSLGHIFHSPSGNNLRQIYLENFEIHGNRAAFTNANLNDGIFIQGAGGLTNSYSVVARNVEVHATTGSCWSIGANRNRPHLTFCYGYDAGSVITDPIPSDQGHGIVINSSADAFIGAGCGFGSAKNRSVFIKTSATPVVDGAEIWWADNVANIHFLECPTFMLVNSNLDRARIAAVKVSGRVGQGYHTPEGMHENGFICNNTFVTPRGIGGVGSDGDADFIQLERTTGLVINNNNFSVDPFNGLDIKVDYILNIVGANVSNINFAGNRWSVDANYIPYVSGVVNDTTVLRQYEYGTTVQGLTAYGPNGVGLTVRRDTVGKQMSMTLSTVEKGSVNIDATRPSLIAASGWGLDIPGAYANDAAAAADGILVGQAYYLASGAVVVRLV